MRIGHFDKWPRATDRFFYGITDPAVSDRDDDQREQDEDATAFATFPNQRNSNENKNWNEETIPADERHQFVENGITQCAVDEMENGEVKFVEPTHELINDQRTHWKIFQFVASVQKTEFDEKSNFQNIGANLLQKLSSSGGSSARGEKVIN